MNCYDFILFQDGRQVFGSREKKEELIARLGPAFEAQHNLWHQVKFEFVPGYLSTKLFQCDSVNTYTCPNPFPCLWLSCPPCLPTLTHPVPPLPTQALPFLNPTVISAQSVPPLPSYFCSFSLVNLYMCSLYWTLTSLNPQSVQAPLKRRSLWSQAQLKLLVVAEWVACALLWWGGSDPLFLASLCLGESVSRLLALRPDIKLAQLSPL